jgi:acetyl-CoA acetyltransferase
LREQDIGDIVIGSVLGDSSQRSIQVRIASFLAGIPENVAAHTVNRCASHTPPALSYYHHHDRL